LHFGTIAARLRCGALALRCGFVELRNPGLSLPAVSADPEAYLSGQLAALLCMPICSLKHKVAVKPET